MVVNNPAGRLWSILNAGHQHNKHKPAEEIWSELLNTPKNNKSLLLRRLGHVMALPSAVHERISTIQDIDHQIYLKWMPQVEGAFGILNFQMQWDQFIVRIDNAAMYGLEICSDVLSRKSPEKTISEADVRGLQDDVEILLTEILKADLPRELRFFLLDHLSIIKSSLEENLILGSAPLEKEFRSVLGAIILDKTLYRRSQKTEPGSRFWKFLTKLALIIQITTGVLQIGTETITILPGSQEEPSPANGDRLDPQTDNDRTTLV